MKLIHLIICLMTGFAASSQEVRWYAEAPSEVTVNGTFEVNFTLDNAEPKDVKFPDFTDFEILQGPSTSRSVSIINGSKSSSFGYGFTLLAEKEGKFTIPPATAKINGKIVSTNAITIQVKKSDLSEKDFTSNDILAKAELKLKPTTAYIGQQVNAVYYIHYGENINMSSNIELPDFKGFFVKPLNLQNKAMGSTTIGNRRFETLLVDALALFPQQAGHFTIDKAIFPLKKKISNNRSFFDPFGNYVDRPIATNDASINIKPLPANAPEHFCGAVGDYVIETTVINTTAEKSGTIILRMKMTGDGDSKQVQIPTIKLGNEFEVFPGKLIDENEFVSAERLYHTKNIEYLITPKQIGQFTINPSINIFDPNVGQYKDISSKPIDLIIGEGKENGKLDLFQYQNGDSNLDSKGSLWVYGILGLGLISGLIFLFIRKKNLNKGITIDPLEQKRINAGKLALSKLTKARQYMDASAHNEFYKETGEAVNNYLQEKYQIATEDLNKNYISNFLVSFDGNEQLIHQYQNISSKADLSIYGGYNNPNTKEVFEDAKSFIETLEMK